MRRFFCNERARSTPLDPKLMFWCVLYHFGAFATIWWPCKTRGKTFRTTAKVRATKSSRIVFATNAPNPPYWTLNSCFGAFCTVLVHLQPFGCLAKLEAKHFELLQTFVPQSRVGIFRNESTRSTPCDPKLMFWCISYHLDAFVTVRLPYKTHQNMSLGSNGMDWVRSS